MKNRIDQRQLLPFGLITNHSHHFPALRAIPVLIGLVILLMGGPLLAETLAPSNLSAIAVSASQINLSWQDNSSSELGFVVECGPSASGPWTQISSTGANAVSYNNGGLSGSTTYYYRVCAYSLFGYSSYSGTVSASTAGGSSCTYSISPVSASVASASTTGSVSVTTGTGCNRTATSSATWITITAGSSGTGSGTVSYSVAANTSTTSRTGTLTIAGNTFTVSQAAGTSSCTYYISPTSASVASTATSGNVNVTTGTGCNRTATSGATWITITAGSSGTGSGTVSYSVAANTSTTSRTGTLTIAGNTFTVSQAAGTSSCTYSISPTSASVASTAINGNVSVTTGTGCNRTATSGATWITITAGSSGTGSGTVSYSVAANTSTTSRTGTLTIAGNTFTVSQAAGTSSCTYSISGSSASFGSAGGPGSVPVTAGGGCTWTASSGVSWVTISSGGSGTGNGTVNYFVAANTGGSRSSSLTIAGRTFTVSQTAATQTTLTSGAYIWSRHFGGASFNVDNAFPSAIKEDRNGDVIVVGSFQKTVNFGGGSMTATASGNNAPDLFIAKYSGSTGAHLWSQRIGSSGSELANGVVVDSANNILVAGTFGGAVDFGGTILTSAGSTDIFVSKYGGNGALLWAKRFGGTAAESCNALALDAANNILLTGAYGLVGTAVDFGGGPLPLSGGQTAFQNDVYVAKLSATGGYLWSSGYGSVGNEQGYGIAVDGNGDVAVIGEFQGTSSFGGGSLTSAGGYDVFVAKYSGSNGSHLWSRKGGSTADDRGRAITFDASGNVLVTGEFQLTGNFGGNALVSANNLAGMFLAKYSPTGTHLFSRGFSAMAPWGFVSGKGIVVDGAGNIVVSGGVTGSADFDGTLLGNGTVDILLAKFSPADGRTLWAKCYGGQMDDYGFAVTIGAADNILATGYYTYTADFGGGVMDSPGGFDGFIAKLKP